VIKKEGGALQSVGFSKS